MDEHGKRYLIERLGDHRRTRNDNRDMRDMRDQNDYDDYDDYDDNRPNRRKNNRRDRRDYDDMRNQDMNDYGEEIPKLSKSDMMRWKREMENADGTKGEHFDMQQVMQAAEKLNIKFRDFSEKEFCLATNIMYSDFCEVIKKFVSQEKEILVCADMAKAYFDDPDGYDPSEKLAIHYHCQMNFG